jgi:hypothetical protein
MGEHLDAALGHLPGREACDREGRDIRTLHGVDRALHLDQRLHAETGLAEPVVRGARIRDREGREMQARRVSDAKLAAERRVRGLKQISTQPRANMGDVAGGRPGRRPRDPG